jgi:tetratricopeptide (TPR) repeat protein
MSLMDIKQLSEQAVELYKTRDSFAAIIFLTGINDPTMSLNVMADIMRHQYWKEKDLVGALAFARAGIQYGLQVARDYDLSDPELAYELRSAAKGFAYNFASFAWRGWNEPGVEITSADHAAGFDSARVNLRLAIELERGDLPTSRAYWMVGAYHLADAEYEQAIENFQQAIAYAKNAGAGVDELLNHGYVLVAKLLDAPDDILLSEDFEKLKTAFREIEHGEDFVQQLETASSIFSKSA